MACGEFAKTVKGGEGGKTGEGGVLVLDVFVGTRCVASLRRIHHLYRL
jgi:hypothetical protein